MHLYGCFASSSKFPVLVGIADPENNMRRRQEMFDVCLHACVNRDRFRQQQEAVELMQRVMLKWSHITSVLDDARVYTGRTLSGSFKVDDVFSRYPSVLPPSKDMQTGVRGCAQLAVVVDGGRDERVGVGVELWWKGDSKPRAHLRELHLFPSSSPDGQESPCQDPAG
ncbi:unnamed protein product [Pleuronectes platessa]|uniref:Uncharacterized protein n=1 Tax=Pleuronectes platessa TaxID=8262 RepID=A0A9N7UDJ9_PLEPL|nr:unnamed protein product [Pleuronectes platessa]